MTQNQLEWMQQSGLDPAEYDMTPDGRVVRRQAAVAQAPQKEVMSPLRAAGTSFLGNLLPAGAGLGAGSLLAPLALSNPWTGIPTVIAGSLAAGYGTGKLQEKALEEFAPEALQQMAQAEQDQPVASWVGGSAPALLTFKPTLKGIEGLSAPLMGGANKMARFAPAAVNVGVNAANAGAGQLLNMSQGGEFSAPRFLADTALGAVLANPNALGRRMGFHPLTPESGPVERLDLAGENARRAGLVDENARAAALAEDQAASARATELLKQDLPGLAEMSGPDARRFQLFENEKAITGMFDQLGLEKNPELIQDLVNDPLLSNFRNDPEALRDYVMQKTGLNRQAAASARQAEAAAFEAEYAGRRTDLGTEPTTKPYEPQDIRRESIAANRKAIQEVLNRMKANPPEEFVQDLANDPFVGNLRNDPQAFQDFVTGKAAKYLESSWRKSLGEINETTRRLEESMAKEEVAEFDREQARRAEARNLGIKDIQPAREAAEEIHQRFQRPGEEGTARITQEDLDVAAQIAARRGLKLTFADLKGGRGSFRLVTKDGIPLIEIDPAAATRDTAIHEIGHDVYARSVGERMKRGLMATAEDSPAFKAEFEARMAARDEQGNPVHTEQQARDLALEEGVIQSFGERYPNVKPGEIRQWFNALKASVKDLMGMKLSPEDAAAYLHYMTHEAVPWKGAAAVKTGDVGEERLQRAQQETPEFKNWFGESKVVDADGKPLRVYHGTRSPQDFNTFRTDSGHNYGPGAYFTPEARRASGYAGEQEGARVYSTYVNVEKPYIVQSDATIQDLGYKLRQDPANDALIQKLLQKYNSTDKNILGNAEVGNAWIREQGYDGIIKQRNRYTEDGYVPEIVEVVAFKPEQIKSATANRGTFDPLNKDIRYQRSLGSKIKTPSELDYLVSKGGPFAEVGTTIKAAANTRDYKQGQWSDKYSLTTKLPEEARVRLLNHLAGEFDTGVRKAPASDIKAAYDQLRNEYLPAIVKDYNTAGFTVRDTAGLRARGSNPTYFPLHLIGETIKDVLTTQQGSAAWDKLKSDFINWNTQLRQADGATLSEAQRYAQEKFEEKLSITAKPPGIESGIPFSGARKPEGYPLPPSWRSNDIIDILNNYTRRSATDFAYQKHVESSPTAMAALGAKTMVNNQPIPANILQSTAPVINDPSVQSVLREYRGTPAQKTEGTLQSLGRFVSAATIGPVSKVGDIGTSMFKGLAYLQGSEYANGLADFTKRIGDWAALKERSYASGLNKRDGAENMRQVFGIAEDSTAFMDKAARVLSKATFVNDLESAARVIAQGWGETIVGINKKLALGGDKNATQMLDTLTKDWRTRSDADLAAQVGRLLQGSYDMRQLPASVLEGAAAPYLTWSKWSIGQYDSFVKYAIQPAMQGNMKPLIGQMLIGVLGGGAISAVQEWLNNREGKDISWKELESWMQQNQGQLGADGGQLLGQKLLSMAQKMGTFGFAGDLVKMTLDAAAGGASQGVATMPAIDAIYDVSKRAAAAGKALDDGEDFGLVLKALLQDSLTGHVQALRVARNWLDEDENLRYDDRRKQRLFDELSGLPSRGGTFAVNYSNLSEREFERGEIGEKTGEEALGLVTRAREQATTPEDYASRIRKYKTSQNQIMPSLERQPMKAARYLGFVEGAKEGAGAETMRRYMTREYENKYRKSLIEGMSGIR